MKTVGIIFFLLAWWPARSFSQDIAHGPSVKASYGSLEKLSVGIGYSFVEFKDDWGWSRPAHNYYFEYLPGLNAFGVSANVQYTLICAKAGLEVSFRSKNELNQPFGSFFPHIGLDLLNVDLSFGPEIVTNRTNGGYVGFKASLKIHPKLFHKGTNRLEFKRSENTTTN